MSLPDYAIFDEVAPGIRIQVDLDGRPYIVCDGVVYDVEAWRESHGDSDGPRNSDYRIAVHRGGRGGPDPLHLVRFVRDNAVALLALAVAHEAVQVAEQSMEEASAVKAIVVPTKREIRIERQIAARMRWNILERDGRKCRYCGATPDTAQLRVDHVVPISKGGRSVPENLVTACFECNAGKGASFTVTP